jgi:hypothetical protein
VKLIQTITLTSAQATIEFTSIPQTFTDLVVLISARTEKIEVEQTSAIGTKFGGTDSSCVWYGDGTNPDSETSGFIKAGLASNASATVNTFGNSILYIPNYASSNTKIGSSTSVNENNATRARQELAAVSSTSTSPITSLGFASDFDLVAGSTISLYGILKGSDGITTAS